MTTDEKMKEIEKEELSDNEKARREKARERAEEKVKAHIGSILALNAKIKKLNDSGRLLSRRFITKNLRKIKKLEAALKRMQQEREAQAKQASKQAKQPAKQSDKEILYKAHVNELKKKNEILSQFVEKFNAAKERVNKETGWLTNEAGTLWNPAAVSNAAKAEKALLAEQKALVTDLFELLKKLKGEKILVQAAK